MAMTVLISLALVSYARIYVVRDFDYPKESALRNTLEICGFQVSLTGAHFDTKS
jgi:hypothetical protein